MWRDTLAVKYRGFGLLLDSWAGGRAGCFHPTRTLFWCYLCVQGAGSAIWRTRFCKFSEPLCPQGASSNFLVLKIKSHKTESVKLALAKRAWKGGFCSINTFILSEWGKRRKQALELGHVHLCMTVAGLREGEPGDKLWLLSVTKSASPYDLAWPRVSSGFLWQEGRIPGEKVHALCTGTIGGDNKTNMAYYTTCFWCHVKPFGFYLELTGVHSQPCFE